MHRRQRYDIIYNNCETLATWLKTGRAYSKQGRNGIIRATTITVIFGAIVGAIFGKSTIAAGTGALIGFTFPLINVFLCGQ